MKFDNFNDNSDVSDELNIKDLKKGSSQTFSVNYRTNTNFKMDIKDNSIYLINILSINCNFEIEFNGEITSHTNLDTNSLIIKEDNSNFTIKPLIDIIDGEEKENYDQKKCCISINSISETQPEVKIENKEDSFFYFNSNNSNYLNISYEIKEISNNGFAALFFRLNETSNFLINITCFQEGNQIEIISKNIYNSSYIYLKSDILNNACINNNNLTLYINIQKNDNKNITMFFKVVEKEMISMLKKDELNYGFITTNTTYKYYYMEVSEEEEGEIMLHNKRFYGELLAKIVSKDDNIDINNISIYPQDNLTDINSSIIYNPHSLKLKYDYTTTSNCFNGCYILITYRQTKSAGDYPTIGYEFTLLSRSWKYSDFVSQIVDIPFNEYILGSFEKDSITHHYYSISIPDYIEEIIIQIEGNYFDAFVGEERKRINTRKIRGNDKNLNIINKQNVITLYKNLNFTKNILSFAFNSKNDLRNIFSFYYFRILQVPKNEIFYFPIDSQLGNLCLPKYNIETELYYCHLKFENNYDELSTNFSVSSPEQNEYFKINVTKISNNNIISEEVKEMFYMFYNDTNDTNKIDYFLFTFEFKKPEIKSLISSLYENIEYYYPHIYSSHMYHIVDFNKTYKTNKTYLFRLKNDYTFITKYIYGSNTSRLVMSIPFIYYDHNDFNRNFRGKPFAINIGNTTKNISFHMGNKGESIFVFKLEYLSKNKGVIEIKPGEVRSQLIENIYFPLYYYLKLKNDNNSKIDVNLRINSYDESIIENEFEIKGYLMDEDIIKRKINGEYIQYTKSIPGIFLNQFKIGMLEVCRNTNDSNNYLLIEIKKIDKHEMDTYLLVEIITKEINQETYFMPINQYLIETFNNANETIRDINKYHILVNQLGNINTQVMIQISPNYDDIEIVFINERNPNDSKFNYTVKYETGFKKYIIYNVDIDNIYFNVINPKNRKANYIIRYYYGKEIYEYKYDLKKYINKKYTNKSGNDNYINLSLTYDQIKILLQNEPTNPSNLTYFIMRGILYNKVEGSEELINTTSLLYERKSLYEAKTEFIYDLDVPAKFTFTFEDISKNDNYIYDLRIQANVFIENSIFNEEFLCFTSEIDLSDIKNEEDGNILWYILGPIFGIIFLLFIFFVYRYIKLKKANTNLKEDLKSMAYSNDVQKDVLQIREQRGIVSVQKEKEGKAHETKRIITKRITADRQSERKTGKMDKR